MSKYCVDFSKTKVQERILKNTKRVVYKPQILDSLQEEKRNQERQMDNEMQVGIVNFDKSISECL